MEFRNGRIEGSVRTFSESVNSDPYLADARYMLGICFFNLNIYEKALRELLIVAD
jgi:hypothetical protein